MSCASYFSTVLRHALVTNPRNWTPAVANRPSVISRFSGCCISERNKRRRRATFLILSLTALQREVYSRRWGESPGRQTKDVGYCGRQYLLNGPRVRHSADFTPCLRQVRHCARKKRRACHDAARWSFSSPAYRGEKRIRTWSKVRLTDAQLALKQSSREALLISHNAVHNGYHFATMFVRYIFHLSRASSRVPAKSACERLRDFVHDATPSPLIRFIKILIECRR